MRFLSCPRLTRRLSVAVATVAVGNAANAGLLAIRILAATYAALVVAILFVLMAVAKKDLKSRVFKNPITQMFEQLFLFIEQMCVSIIGPHGRKYVPLIGTFWLMIFLGNLVALFFPTSPTADLLLDDCRVPESARLGEEGEGAAVEKIVDDTLRQEALKALGAYVKKR